jgi:DDE family transposase
VQEFRHDQDPSRASDAKNARSQGHGSIQSSEDLHTLDREHRQHAEVEFVIRDLKDQALAHFPSGRFAANAAWTVIACLAHNLQRWTGMLGLQDPTPRMARTIRRWLLTIPARLTRTARQWTLHPPARWPWQRHFFQPGAAGEPPAFRRESVDRG